MHTFRLVVALAVALAVVATTVVPGCAGRRRAEKSVVTRTYADTMFENHADVPVRMTIWACQRTSTPPGIGSTFRDVPRVLAPNEKFKALVNESRPYGVGFLWPEGEERVIRIKLERLGATWESPAAAWYEVVGPMPKLARIVAGEANPNHPEVAPAPVLEADDARIELVPRDWWPKEE